MPVKTTTAGVIPSSLFSRAEDHLRTNGSPADSDTLNGAVAAAVVDFERETGVAVFNQTRVLYADRWSRRFDLRSAPVTGLTSVTYYDEDGVEQTVDSANYSLDQAREVAEVVLKTDYDWPALDDDTPHPIRITFTAGYGTAIATVPELILSAILFYAGHLYDNRDAESLKHLQTVKDTFFNRYKLNFFGSD